MLFSAFLFALAAVPALSAPGRAKNVYDREVAANPDPWQTTELWLEGLDRMKEFE